MFDCPGSNPCATTRERSISRSSTCTPAEVVALDPPPAGEYASIAFRFQFHWRLLALESEATPGVELVASKNSSGGPDEFQVVTLGLRRLKRERAGARETGHHLVVLSERNRL